MIGRPGPNVKCFVASFFYNKCIEFECKNRPILEPMEESLMNDEDNKYINSINGALNEKIGGEYGEVVYGGKVFPQSPPTLCWNTFHYRQFRLIYTPPSDLV